MTTNKPMTGEQLDELMTVAVNMQRDSEKAGERSVAIFAYAVQVAVLELRKVRDIKPADEDHVAAMNSITAIITILGSSDTLGISEQVAELKAQRDTLAAENAGLKSKGRELLGEACAVYAKLNKLIDPAIGDFIDGQTLHEFQYVLDCETPDTDAFLAEVRAQGVEMFAAHKRERQQALRSRSMRMSEEAAGMAADAEEFAAQLRKGVQS